MEGCIHIVWRGIKIDIDASKVCEVQIFVKCSKSEQYDRY